MELTQNQAFDITEYCGNLIVTYFSEDKESANALIKILKEEGYDCIANELSFHTVMKNSYVNDFSQLLDECGCYVLLLSPAFDNPKYRSLRNQVWYQTGYLQSKRTGAIVPMQLGDGNVNLAGSPISQSHVVKSAEELLRAFSHKFHTSLAKAEFYENPTLNSYANRRIDYRKMIVKMDITTEDFRRALDAYCEEAEDEDIDEKDFEKILRDNLDCGAKLISFGGGEEVTAQLSVYRAESYPIPIDYPQNFTNKKLYVARDGKKGLHAEYLLELIMPIHRLFGVCFKPYIQSNDRDLTARILQTLFASNFTKKNDVVLDGNRIWFSLNFPNAKVNNVDKQLGIGTKADFLYPQ